MRLQLSWMPPIVTAWDGWLNFEEFQAGFNVNGRQDFPMACDIWNSYTLDNGYKKCTLSIQGLDS